LLLRGAVTLGNPFPRWLRLGRAELRAFGLTLIAVDSDVVMSRCIVTATGAVAAFGPAGAALSAQDSRITITGDGSGGFTASPEPEGAPAVTADPETTRWIPPANGRN
jgi:hypothetical protein